MQLAIIPMQPSNMLTRILHYAMQKIKCNIFIIPFKSSFLVGTPYWSLLPAALPKIDRVL